MRNKKGIVPLLAGLVLSSNVSAQAHQHGHGEVFVVQDDKQWQVQFTLPAADVFGFEHEPENDEQHAKVDAQLDKLEVANNVLVIPSQCELLSYDLESPFIEHEDHHDHHDEHEEGHGEEHHSDVELAVTLNCATPIEEINFKILNVLTSLEEIDVMWAVDKGQGSKEITQSDPSVGF